MIAPFLYSVANTLLLWISSGSEEAESIMVAPYPRADERFEDPKAESDMEAVKAAIHAGRSLRSTYNIVPAVRVLEGKNQLLAVTPPALVFRLWLEDAV